MRWEKPEFAEIALACEIGSYASAELWKEKTEGVVSLPAKPTDEPAAIALWSGRNVRLNFISR